MNNTELTIDISTLWRILKKHAFFIIIFTVIASALALSLSMFVIPKKYAASAKFYVENRQSQDLISINDINTARNIASTCIELFSTNQITERLIDSTGLNHSIGEMKSMITMNAVNNSEFLQITVTMDSSRTAIQTLDAFVTICLEEFSSIIDSGKIKVIDPAVAGESAVFPKNNVFLAIGFLLGFMISYLIVFVIEILDTKVKAEDDLYKLYDIPVFAEILNFSVVTKGEYSYEYK